MTANLHAIRPLPSIAGRVPPNDLDAEAAVLSAALLSGEALDAVMGILRPEHFYSDANGWIYQAALGLHATSSPVDLVSVASWLRTRERLADIGGPSYLAQIADATPATAHVAAHAKTVLEKWRMRSIIAVFHTALAEAYGDYGVAEEFLEGVAAAVDSVVQDRRDDSTTTMREALAAVFGRLATGKAKRGLATGIEALDRIIVGMKPGQLIIVGAGTSVGKSALALNIAINVYTRPPAPSDLTPVVLIFSAEMTHEELAERALFSDARVDASKQYDYDRVNAEDWAKLTEAAQWVGRDTCIIDDRARLTPLAIRAKARSVAAKCAKRGQHLALVVVDYIQLLNGRAGLDRNASREQEISAIGQALKDLSKEVAAPVVALSQLNDDAAKRAPRRSRSGSPPSPEDAPRPRMSDVRESKALSMHADKVILIHNPSAEARTLSGDRAPTCEECELIVDKNRGGRKGCARVAFYPHFTLFADLPGPTVGAPDYSRAQEAP